MRNLTVAVVVLVSLALSAAPTEAHPRRNCAPLCSQKVFHAKYRWCIVIDLGSDNVWKCRRPWRWFGHGGSPKRTGF